MGWPVFQKKEVPQRAPRPGVAGRRWRMPIPPFMFPDFPKPFPAGLAAPHPGTAPKAEAPPSMPRHKHTFPHTREASCRQRARSKDKGVRAPR